MLLRPVRTVYFVPRGARFDPRLLLRQPVRALRGGDDGLAVSFAMRGPELGVTVLARGAAPGDDVDDAVARARAMAAVDDDPTEFCDMVRGHAVLGDLSRRFDCRLSRTATVFESFAEAVIAQLVTSDEAKTSWRRLWRVAGERITGTDLVAAPTARAVREVPAWRMHTLGIGARRLKTLREGAGRGVAIERIARELPPATFVDKLMSMHGVGPWTANRVARSALGYADAVPIGDLHAPSIVTEALAGEAAFRDDEAMLAALETFRPHRARVMFLLERAHLTPAAFGGPGRRARRPRVDPHRREPWKY